MKKVEWLEWMNCSCCSCDFFWCIPKWLGQTSNWGEICWFLRPYCQKNGNLGEFSEDLHCLYCRLLAKSFPWRLSHVLDVSHDSVAGWFHFQHCLLNIRTWVAHLAWARLEAGWKIKSTGGSGDWSKMMSSRTASPKSSHWLEHDHTSEKRWWSSRGIHVEFRRSSREGEIFWAFEAGMVLDPWKIFGRCWYLQILQSIKSIIYKSPWNHHYILLNIVLKLQWSQIDHWNFRRETERFTLLRQAFCGTSEGERGIPHKGTGVRDGWDRSAFSINLVVIHDPGS